MFGKNNYKGRDFGFGCEETVYESINIALMIGAFSIS
jgi:hypothetical protein